MRKIVLATQNEGKIREMKSILGDTFQVIPMAELNYLADIVEYGKTFSENSEIKTIEILKWGFENGYLHIGDAVLAEDSGFCVESLPNELGVYSARFMGKNTPYEVKNAKVIELLSGLPQEQRTCSYVADICIGQVLDNFETKIIHFTGEVTGYVGDKPLGNGGFAYDPIFYLPSKEKKSMATISYEEKNKISHRSKAIQKAIDYLLN